MHEPAVTTNICAVLETEHSRVGVRLTGTVICEIKDAGNGGLTELDRIRFKWLRGCQLPWLRLHQLK